MGKPILARYDKALIWYDGPQLSVLVGEDGDKFLSIWVHQEADNNIDLCVPVSEDELKEYGWDEEHYNIHTIYANATSFYTSSDKDYECVDNTHSLKPIVKEDIPAEWWPVA